MLPLPELGGHDDLATVHLGDPARDRQAQAGAGDRERLGVARAVEGREQVHLVGGGDAESGVGAQHVGVLPVVADLEVDGAPGRLYLTALLVRLSITLPSSSGSAVTMHGLVGTRRGSS